MTAQTTDPLATAPRTSPLLTAALRTAVLARLANDADAAAAATDRAALRRAVSRALAAEGVVLSPQRWAQAVRDLVDEVAGLGPIESLLRDPRVTDVCCNAPDEIWVDRGNELEPAGVSFDDDEQMVAIVRRAAARVGKRWDAGHPLLDARLPGGLRVHAVLPPLASSPVVTVRRVATIVPTWHDLLAGGSVTEPARDVLVAALRERRNVVVCGRAGSGKTTLLARMLGEVSADRVILIEDTPELGHPSRHSLALQTLGASPDGHGEVDLEELLRNALRMRPDRLVVGEVRGREVATLLQAMNTGHAGSMTTVHANGADDAMVRLEGMALLAGLPLAAVRSQLASAIEVVVAMERRPEGRVVSEIAEIDRAATQSAADGRLRLVPRYRRSA